MTTTIGERLRHARVAAGDLGTRELDRLAGLTVGHTSAIESGRRPSIEARTAARLACVLGLSLDWFVNGTGRRPTVRSIRRAVRRARASARSDADSAAA